MSCLSQTRRNPFKSVTKASNTEPVLFSRTAQLPLMDYLVAFANFVLIWSSANYSETNVAHCLVLQAICNWIRNVSSHLLLAVKVSHMLAVAALGYHSKAKAVENL